MKYERECQARTIAFFVLVLWTAVMVCPGMAGTRMDLFNSTGGQGRDSPDPWHGGGSLRDISAVSLPIPVFTLIPTSAPVPAGSPVPGVPVTTTLEEPPFGSQIGQGSGGPPEEVGSPNLSANRIVEILAGMVIAALGSFVDVRRYPSVRFRPRFRAVGIILFLLTAGGAFLVSAVLPAGGSVLVRSISIVGGVVAGTSCLLEYALVKGRRLPFTLGIHLLGSGIIAATFSLSFIASGDVYMLIAASALFTGSLLYAAMLLLSPGSPEPETISLSDKTFIGMDMADPRLHTAVLEERYTDIVPIATGGLARVYRAVRKEDGLTIAVKIPLTTTEATGRAFLKEMLLWRDLNHPNIIKVTYVAVLPVPLVEMEYMEMSLSRIRKPVPIDEAIRIIEGIAHGLAYAHSKGIIHRDIKPANIMIAPDRTPKITDWGLGRSIVYPDMPTVTGFSLSYAAPEQVAPSDFGGTDHRTDIFQLGVVSYELVTGMLPFPGDDLATVTRAILTRNPVIPSLINPEARPLDAIILRSLAKDPRQRFQTVNEFLAELADVQSK